MNTRHPTEADQILTKTRDKEIALQYLQSASLIDLLFAFDSLTDSDLDTILAAADVILAERKGAIDSMGGL